MSNGADCTCAVQLQLKRAMVDGCGICPWSDAAQSAGYPSCAGIELLLGSHRHPHPGVGTM